MLGGRVVGAIEPAVVAGEERERSVSANAARSRSLKSGDSRHAASAWRRRSVSPSARAWRVCMSMQYAHPLSWEARILTSS